MPKIWNKKEISLIPDNNSGSCVRNPGLPENMAS